MLQLLGIALSLLMVGCDNSDPKPQMQAEDGTITLNFTSTFGNQPLVMYDQAYSYESELEIKLQLFQFYLTDITLIGDTIGEVELSEIELVSFKEIFSLEDAQKGINLSFDEIPPGKYDRIRFGIGVNPTLNDTEPADYQIGHPLTDNYWSAAAGYVFFKIEGNTDYEKDDVFDDKLAYHVGKNDYFRETSLDFSVVVPEGDNATLSFTVDLLDVLRDPATGAFIDLFETPTDHTNDPEVASFLADNMKKAIQIK